MGLLNDLIARLAPGEISTVKEKGLTQTENKLFDLVLAAKGEEAAYTSLKLSDAHLRKTQSVLYEKILLYLGADEPSRIQFLADKRLFDHLMHWVAKVEKRLIKQQDFEALRPIYNRTARLLPNGEISGFNVGFMDKLEGKFAQYFPEDLIGQQLVKLHKLHMQFGIRREFPGKKLDVDLEAEVLKAEKKAEELEDPQVHFWTLFLKMQDRYDLQNEEVSVTRKQVDELIENYGSEIPENDYIYMLVTQADMAYVESHFEQAFEDLEKLFERYPEVLTRKVYWSDVFAQLCIKLGQLERARETLLKAHEVTVDPKDNMNTDLFAPYAYFALIDLLQENYPAAFGYILHCQQEVKKSHFFWLDAMIKILENTYFLLTRDFVLADDLAGKHIKFYNYHKDKPEVQIFKDFHNILRFCARQTDPGVELPAAYLSSYREWQQGDLAFIGLLLDKALKSSGVVLPTTT